MEKINTPYGEKNWNAIKKILDSHIDLLEACELAFEELDSKVKLDEYQENLLETLSKAINKAKGNHE